MLKNNKFLFLSVAAGCLLLNACSTRQAGERFTGSTEQRLVTYSIQKMAQDVANQPLSELQDQTVIFESHFVIHNQVQHYAEEQIKTVLQDKFNVAFLSQYQSDNQQTQISSNLNQSDEAETNPQSQTQLSPPMSQPKYKLKLFFTSLGTDRDQAGFSFPIINLAEPERSTSISILAIDMYHGIAECTYYLEDLATNRIVKTGKVNARVKTDKFTTPIFGFPISDIED
ncbi:hypothetical protein N7931_03330 [Catenovulum sp. 2E275]|uniref:hypothetical protein n=1 Tax=Catenovulum sp. 2E275 TaxID=2980497 RepID=UPI0021D15D2D|nr:hypothetical protein [Catenovulum sp. 2E275]MCU4674657.1 hypothetical protein [Catenovulum sp. 2E275]